MKHRGYAQNPTMSITAVLDSQQPCAILARHVRPLAYDRLVRTPGPARDRR